MNKPPRSQSKNYEMAERRLSPSETFALGKIAGSFVQWKDTPSMAYEQAKRYTNMYERLTRKYIA